MANIHKKHNVVADLYASHLHCYLVLFCQEKMICHGIIALMVVQVHGPGARPNQWGPEGVGGPEVEWQVWTNEDLAI